MPTTVDLNALTQVPPAAGWAAVAFLVAWLMRQTVLKARADINEMKSGAAIANGLDSLQTRVDLLDERVNKLEGHKALLVSFCYKVLAHFAGCTGCSKREAARQTLQDEFNDIMGKVTK
jgi:hypothetical protein